MNSRVNELLQNMETLEAEFHAELRARERILQERFVATRAELRTASAEVQAKIQEAAQQVAEYSLWRHILSIPFIYMMIVPLVIMDIMLTVYQQICFRLYRIPTVSRGAHFVIDRQLLATLNLVDKFNCMYCGYGNGVFSYGREIISRTEQYWCPIKHAQKILDESERYRQFLDYEDTENYHQKLQTYRENLRGEEARSERADAGADRKIED